MELYQSDYSFRKRAKSDVRKLDKSDRHFEQYEDQTEPGNNQIADSRHVICAGCLQSRNASF